MEFEKNFVKVILATMSVGTVLAVSTISAFGQGESATCPKDGEQAQRVNIEQIHSESCRGVAYNAERDTYSHTHINGPLLEQHTFATTTCLSQ
jgi:hypothetical protein